MNVLRPRLIRPLLAAASLLVFGYASPPEAEKKAAHDAVSLAKAAGADRYAASEFTVMTAAVCTRLDLWHRRVSGTGCTTSPGTPPSPWSTPPPTSSSHHHHESSPPSPPTLIKTVAPAPALVPARKEVVEILRGDRFEERKFDAKDKTEEIKQ